MISLIKMNLKLLLRNKGFLFFLLVTPIVSAFILNMKAEHNIYANSIEEPQIVELKHCSNRAVYLGDSSAYIVKVYDASGTELSEYILEQLLESGMFSVCRCDVSKLTEKEVFEQAKKDAFDDRAGTLLYLKRDFDQAVLEGNLERGLQIYQVSADERWELFESELTSLFQQMIQVQQVTGKDSKAMMETLYTMDSGMPEKRIVSLAGKDEVELTNEQINHRTHIGYAFAIITLGFLFCGVCIAHTVIEEQNNKVFTRVMLSKVTSRDYFLSKFVVTFLITLMQTLVLAVCIFAVSDMDFGIQKITFLAVIFLLGLIFSTLSLLLGILLGDAMNANYAVFSIWTISALLSGLYFPLDDTTAAINTLSYLMPQRWFMNASELLLAGDKGAYSMLLYVTVAYLIVIISVGSIGLKMKKGEA